MKSKIIINNGSTIKKRRYFIHWELNFHVTINVKSIKISLYLFQPSSFLSRSYFHHSLFSSRLIIAFHPSLASPTNGCQPSTRTKVASHVIDAILSGRGRERKKARAREIPWKRRRWMVERKTVVPIELGNRRAGSVIRSSTVLTRVNEQGWTLTRIGWRHAIGRGQGEYSVAEIHRGFSAIARLFSAFNAATRYATARM